MCGCVCVCLCLCESVFLLNILLVLKIKYAFAKRPRSVRGPRKRAFKNFPIDSSPLRYVYSSKPSTEATNADRDMWQGASVSKLIASNALLDSLCPALESRNGKNMFSCTRPYIHNIKTFRDFSKIAKISYIVLREN